LNVEAPKSPNGFVTLADGLLEAGLPRPLLARPLLERIALLGVAGDAIEDGAQNRAHLGSTKLEKI
jgi:hypothetical protein